ncbi:hypothetical protein QQS21_001844 [Conoideocrella luteorostrata]|uniref:N-acetyltransferase domain-containing protein n=1 Tax=Conoideocrella luteorostrata TaxID=1105319 RepID=A0AAJ0CW72_9HYPO|nr:hypothetical protein QQS21_001844 [Conoideocrella luteorostrata]
MTHDVVQETSVGFGTGSECDWAASNSAVVEIRIADISVAENAKTVASLIRIVNSAYEAEADLFIPGYHRTSEAEIVKLLREGVMAVAYMPVEGGLTHQSIMSASLSSTNKHMKAVGCVYVKQISARLGTFGMLALEPEHQGGGLGRAMVHFAEEHCRRKRCTVMQLELLVPITYEHALKSRLQAWYQRLGYRVVKHGSLDQQYPNLARQLIGTTVCRVFQKDIV